MKMIELAIYQLYVVVLIALTGITRTVSDRNNPPRVIIPSNKAYLVVFENTANGTVISDLNAVDPGDTLICSPTPGTGTEKFVKVGESVLKDATAGKWMWNIILITELDRDHSPSQVSLFFNVEDLAGNIVNAKVVMIIADVNDNAPTLTGLPYTRTLPESLAVSSSVYNFSSDDPDDGKGGGVKYSMKANDETDEYDYESTFELNPENGAVVLKRNLDYEGRSFYHFKVSAKDTGNPSCPGENCLCKGAPDNCNGNEVDFYITVTDEEDTPPVFERQPYMDTVDENAPINFTILTVRAVDGDRGVAKPSQIQYTLSDLTVPFSVNDNGNIVVSRNVDADEKTLRERGGLYSFNVTATEVENGQSTSTLVSLVVKDVNDNAPVFNKYKFTADVLENTPKGVPLNLNSAIQISDEDQGINSRFRVFIEATNDSQKFALSTIPDENQIVLGTSSISITVNDSTLLDFESTRSITCKLIAREVIGSAHSPMLGSQFCTAMVTVYITDVNDNSPEEICPKRCASPTTVQPDLETTKSVINHNFDCDITSLSVHVPVEKAPNSKLTLKDPSCELVSDGTHYVLHFKFDECGTSVSYFKDYIHITNTILVHKDFGPISLPIEFEADYNIPIKCSLKRETFIEGSFQTVTRPPVIEVDDGIIPDINDMHYELREFKTAAYEEEITEYPVKIPINKEVYFELSVNDPKPDIGIEIQSCVATPSEDPEDQVAFELIKNGCPATLAANNMASSTATKRRFRVQAFHFSGSINNHNTVYIHCQVKLCLPLVCSKPKCTERRRRRSLKRTKSRRSKVNGSHVYVSYGPLIRA